jgi:ribosomal protein S18 acetylase RimI-like enzyme
MQELPGKTKYFQWACRLHAWHRHPIPAAAKSRGRQCKRWPQEGAWRRCPPYFAEGRAQTGLDRYCARVTVQVELLRDVTDEVLDAFGRLLPQLSGSAPPLDKAALEAIVACSANTVLLSRSAGLINGTLTLVMFPAPTGLRAWIEDVVVDESARGQGAGVALTVEALRLAQAAGARTVDLTSRPSREAAGRLYERVGFEVRSSRLYRFNLAAAEIPARSASGQA